MGVNVTASYVRKSTVKHKTHPTMKLLAAAKINLNMVEYLNCVLARMKLICSIKLLTIKGNQNAKAVGRA